MRAVDPKSDTRPSLEEALAQAATAAARLPEGPLKEQRLETLSVVRNLTALIETAQRVALRSLDLHRIVDDREEESHAGR